MRPPLTENAVLVMAHPDDEVLWASSVLRAMDRIVLCFEETLSFPAWGEGRRRSLAAFPLPGVESLGLTEAEVFDGAAWPEPAEGPHGLAVRRHPGSMAHFSESRHAANFATLLEALRPVVAGRDNVITHAPWGEYGHEEHVQVFRAVAALQAEAGFELWVPAYVSDRSYRLMLRSLPQLDCGLPPRATDPDLGAELKALYRETGCWTWFDDYAWPARESFYRRLRPGETPVPPHPGGIVNLIWTGWSPRRPVSPLRRLARRGRRLFAR